jgi:hypothetical protein
MPIHDLGYRSWQGRLCSQASRWLVITETGVRLAWRAPWLRRLVFVAWLPALYMGIAFFMYEQSLMRPQMQRLAMTFFRDFGGSSGQAMYEAALIGDPATARHEVWGWLLLLFFRHPQGVLMALVVGLIAPPLISQDIRTRAFLLYFSRPLTRIEYILGKMAVVWTYVVLITTIPALALYLAGVMLSPDLSVVGHTWDFPLRILVASVILTIPTTSVALSFSALTTRSYYASFGWFAVWAFGLTTYFTLYATLQDLGRWNENWSLVSLHHTLGKVQTWVFDIGGVTFSDVLPSILMLTGVTVVSFAIIYQRISAYVKV